MDGEMKFVTAERRFGAITMWVSATDVRRALGCSRAHAYEHLRRAANRGPDQRGLLLRVELHVWERYAKEVLGCRGSTSAVAPGGAGSTRTASVFRSPPGAGTGTQPKP